MRHILSASALFVAVSLSPLSTTWADSSVGNSFTFLRDMDTVNGHGPASVKAAIIGYGGVQDNLIQDPTVNAGYVLGYLNAGLADAVLKDPAPATVTFVDPADYLPPELYVFSQSTLFMTGGRIRGEVNNYGSTVYLGDTSSLDANLVSFGGTVTVDGGSIGNPLLGSGVLDVVQGTTVHVMKGYVGSLALNGSNTTANIAGGTIGHIEADFGANVVIQNGLVRGDVSSVGGMAYVAIEGGQINGGVTASSDGAVDVVGGSIVGSLAADTGGNIALLLGSVGGNFSVNPNSQGQITNGNVNGNAVSDGGMITITGGTVGMNVQAFGSSSAQIGTINISGGIVEGTVYAETNGMVGVSGDVQILGGLNATTNSQVNMTGGTVAGSVDARGNGAVVFLGRGEVQQGVFVAHGGAVQVLDNAHVDGNITASNNSRVSMTGGQVSGEINGQDFAQLSISGGVIGLSVSTINSSYLSMIGGTVFGDADAFDSSSMDLAGGAIVGDLNLYDNARVVVAGTNVLGSINAHGDATLVMLIRPPSSPGGGALHALPGGDLETRNSTNGGPALAKLLGAAGVLQADTDPTGPLKIFLYDDSMLEIDGFNFSTSLLDPNNNNMFSEYQLSGYFADGSPFGGGLGIQLFVQNGTAASFALVEVPHVPEPSGLMLLAGIGTLLGLVRPRRFQRA